MGGIVEGHLGKLIDRFYEAAAHQTLWRSVLQEASDVLGTEGIELYPGPHTRFAPVHSSSLDDVVATGIAENWFADNPRVNRGVPLLTRNHDLITESTIFSPDELDRLPFNAEFAGRFELRWFTAAYLSSGGPPNILLSIERRADQEPFSRREQDLIRLILPHLRRSAQLAVSFADAHAQGRLDAIDAMRSAGFLIDLDGRVVHANAQADRLLGTCLAMRQGRLRAVPQQANDSLQALITAVTQRGLAHEAPALGPVGIPRPGASPLIVHAAPIVGTAQDIFHRSCAVLTIVDPDARRELDAQLLRQLFGLTSAEARLALVLLSGQTIKQASMTLGVTEGTLRFQLRQIFGKTGTSRQPKLMSLLIRSASL